MAKIKSNHPIKFWAGLLLAQFVLFYLLSKMDAAVGLFVHLFEVKKYVHQKLFSFLSFSVGDVFYTVLAVVLFYHLLQLVKGPERKGAAKNLFIFLNIFYFVYQSVWGMLYFQKPLAEKLHEHTLRSEELKILAEIYLEKCRETRKQVNENEQGVFIIINERDLKKDLLFQETKIPSYFNSRNSVGVLSLKPSIFDSVMSYTGILGYYNPFTAEAQYNAELPSTYLPFTLAHESAHQLGYAREEEANFIGYLIGKNASNRDLRYSTEYFVLKSLLRSLKEDDSAFVEKLIMSFSPEMQRDRLAEKEFADKHDGLLNVIFGISNDLFLKSNQQDGAVSYSYFVDLLLRYERDEVEYK